MGAGKREILYRLPRASCQGRMVRGAKPADYDIMINYEKVMTRDAPLTIVEAWRKAFTTSIPEATGTMWPEPVFRLRSGVVESWRASRLFHVTTPKKFATWIFASPAHQRCLLDAMRAYQRYAKDIRRLPTGQDAKRAVHTLTTVIALLTKGLAGLIPAYWCVEWNEREHMAGHGALFPARIVAMAKKIRAHDTFFDDAVGKVSLCLDRIARARRLPRRLLDYMLLDEIIELVPKPNIPELQRRAAGYVYVEGRVFTGRSAERALASRGYRLQEIENAISGREIQGTPAYPGKVHGRIAVCLSPREIGKVRRGDILVAAMTTPRYLPAMKQAAAFVTDEGGILCHAAIVARELKKPCIIGTQIATKVFKDGERVEVDVERGIVKRL